MGSEIIWADCEMTGLSLEHDVLIEIAVLVTDGQLNILGEGVDIVIHADDAILSTMNDVVKNMHQRSGLIEQVRNSPYTINDAQSCVMEYVQAHTSAKSAPLAGNSIATDRGFIARDMPVFNDFLHYRMIDVSSIKELCRRWYPNVYFHKPDKGLAHRALADIKESIIELHYYRQALFLEPPGYDTEKLIQIRQGIAEFLQGS